MLNTKYEIKFAAFWHVNLDCQPSFIYNANIYLIIVGSLHFQLEIVEASGTTAYGTIGMSACMYWAEVTLAGYFFEMKETSVEDIDYSSSPFVIT